MDYFEWQLAKEIEDLVVDYGMEFGELVEKAVELFQNNKGDEGDFS